MEIDHTSTAKELATEIGCSVATVNSKVAALGIKFKGRSPDDHQRLMEAVKNVKPRRTKSIKPKNGKKSPRGRKPSKVVPSNGDFPGNLMAYFNQGKELISTIRKRLDELEKEKADLNEKLEALLLLHPDMR